MSEPFVAEITIFAGNFAPRGYAFCNGALLPIAQNTALFSLLGTVFGGDGRTTVGLPDLEGRIPMMWGRGPGLTDYRIGQRVGAETVALTAANLAAHTHQGRAAQEDATTNNPTGASLGIADETIYNDAGTQVTMGAQALAETGAASPAAHDNNQPYLALNFLIALQGVYPSRS